jgi:CheY-like chemotaxis protein
LENARIAVFEDNETLRDLLRHMAALTGHTVVAEAINLDEATGVIENIEFDVAVVDGNLEKSRDLSCKDGKAVVNAIRTYRQGAKIIWFSSVPLPKTEVDYDFDSGKDVVTVMDAIEAI